MALKEHFCHDPIKEMDKRRFGAEPFFVLWNAKVEKRDRKKEVGARENLVSDR